MKSKNCSVCHASFSCNSSGIGAACWCSQYPAIESPKAGQDCCCPDCLRKTVKEEINHLMQTKTKDVLIEIAGKYSGKESLIEGIDYYMEKGLWVFTAWYHLKRGHCCESGCRHCP